MAVEPKAVDFGEAIAYFRQKLNLPTKAWTDLWEAQHARAFVVAGAMKEDLVADLRNAVAKAIEQGTTLAEFRTDFDQIVAKHGWSYKGQRGWRTGVIYNTNLRMAYAAGKWQQAEQLKDRRPYLRYVAILDRRTRPDHKDWHGTVLAMDDPWWKTHYPPNGWGCRCTVQQLSPRDLDRYGYQINDQAPPVEWENRTVRTPQGDTTVQAPKGIDTGFAYNVGHAAWGQSAQLAAMERHGPWEPLAAPGAAPATELVKAEKPQAKLGKRADNEADLRTALRLAIGGDQAVFTDPTGGRVNITQAIVDHMLEKASRMDGRDAFFPFIREVVEDPAEIWVGFAQSGQSSRVVMRRRYVKLLDLGKDTTVGIVADVDGGQWSGVTFFRGGARTVKTLRQGLRIYRKD